PVPDCRRKVAGPRPAFSLENPKYETITPIPYDIIKEASSTFLQRRGAFQHPQESATTWLLPSLDCSGGFGVRDVAAAGRQQGTGLDRQP
ncbi:hypothetical protein WJX84_010364, partial [Apatococcus fuscideae]